MYKLKIILLTAILLAVASVVSADDEKDWLTHLNGLGFWERLAEIRSVSELPKAKQKERVPALIRLLKDKNQSIRLTAAKELTEIRDSAASAIPHLIDNFKYENGEEGADYVEAVSFFGTQALPLLETALKSDNWLIRARACDAIRIIAPKTYLDGECRKRASWRVAPAAAKLATEFLC